MSLCAVFKSKFTPFLIAPLLGSVVAAATWFTTPAAGLSALQSQLATGLAFVGFVGLIGFYVSRCLSRFPTPHA